jgi:hypothetical protein
MTQLILSDASNARRKAKLMIEKGEAPTMQFSIEKRGDKEFAIVWGGKEEVVDDQSKVVESAREMEVRSTYHAQTSAVKPPSKRAERQGKRAARNARIQASQAAAAPPAPAAAALPLDQRTGKRGPRGKYNAPASTNGGLPPKPVITSATNQAYQRHIDALAELAEAGKWDEVVDYKLNKNPKQSYAKVLSQYHDRLMAFRINSLALA